MNGFVGFMQSWIGRLLRIVAGLALIAVGLFVMQGAWGYVVAVIGLVPLLAGIAGNCLLAPLFGYTLPGAPRSAQL
jgi:Inner membrane protein YgaP-like, transmembrane domain